MFRVFICAASGTLRAGNRPFGILAPRREIMTSVAEKPVVRGCLAPIDRGGLEQLIANGKANPKVIKTLKCKTVAEGKFRHANYIRNLAPYTVDEPPGLLGDDTAPNPSEASLAALGSCLAVGLRLNSSHLVISYAVFC